MSYIEHPLGSDTSCHCTHYGYKFSSVSEANVFCAGCTRSGCQGVGNGSGGYYD